MSEDADNMDEKEDAIGEDIKKRIGEDIPHNKDIKHLLKESIKQIDFITTLKENPAYKEIDIDKEVGKMKAWLSCKRNKHRKLTEKFILTWLNRVEFPLKVKNDKSW
jgi:hypothetical protein